MDKLEEYILLELQEAKEVLDQFSKSKKNISSIKNAALLICKAFQSGNKILSCGNGGSHCDSMHFSEELIGRYRENRIGYPAISISDSSYISCVANDYGYDEVFCRYVESVGKEGDILFAISTSGNSKNIVKAAEYAKSKKMYIISLTGKDGGQIAKFSDIEIRVPHFRYSDRIQEIHIKIIHILVFLIEKEMKK
ncbi:D-sedoheptulose 7-phosphate isomerase [Candidatus Riesia pediculicola]|uniref:Phosphoheptose isomerase n=1 Tax=Riesia pediculicola (strain USDA) TaxID=515618 RepID=D4G7M6_RIEPU|nr:D-sedoheptulose 7-phosphate isomerase [Candidatus Riesia pediculicola]ADD79671.1 phosphoheptose isomerase [Candidatus Riesia pediculicola USDA]ARC53601.1 phosphoheptose isomerase [Candidatus Riesia pediculicola]QOJ86254.1 D-sedoheptulose 7-phosphate isomerase [Candidatus Riesia pediculicola]